MTFVFEGDNIVFNGFTINQYTGYSAIEVMAENVTISNTTIDFKAVEDFDYDEQVAISAVMVDNLKLLNNTITYVGNSNATSINNAVRIEEESSNILIQKNKFDIQLVSKAVGYDEDYNSVGYSEGIVFFNCENITFDSNSLILSYSNYSGYYDTIKALVIGNGNYDYEEYEYMNRCNNVVISNNTISAYGHAYLYGVSIVADNFNITDNTITMLSDNYVAAFEIGGPSDEGNISDNEIFAASLNYAYGIYAYQYSGVIDNMIFSDNTLKVEAYAACAMNLVLNLTYVDNNTINVYGNHTTGISANFNNEGLISNNNIAVYGNNVGNASTGDSYIHLESTAVAVNGYALIVSNNISSTAIGVDLTNYGKGVGAYVSDNVIFVNSSRNTKNYGILAYDGEIDIIENNITFIGYTDGSSIVSAAVYVSYVDDMEVRDNHLYITVPSAAIAWSATWEPTILSEGAVFKSCDNLTFENNSVSLGYNDIVGSYDTIYVIDISGDNATVNNNIVIGYGNTYIYGIVLTGDGFNITDNYILMNSNYYANGIDIEGPAEGLINNNSIFIAANTSAYPIYSGMSNGDVTVVIVNNDIAAYAYFVVGMEIQGSDVGIANNTIDIEGNYTVGIGVYVDEAVISNNEIISKASNEGNESIWDAIGTDTTGIKISKGNFTISGNDIETTGDYAIIYGDNSGNITNNQLLSNSGAGNDAITGLGTVNATGNPYTNNKYLKVVLFADDLSVVEGSTGKYIVKVLDENGNAVYNKTIEFLIDGVKYATAQTDFSGLATLNVNLAKGEYTVTAKFSGDDEYGYKSISNDITVTAKPATKTATKITAKKKTFKAKKKTKKYAITLKAGSKAVSKVKVTIKVGKKTYKATTNAKGKATFKIKKLTKKGKYTATVKFAGNSLYKASSKKVKITVKK